MTRTDDLRRLLSVALAADEPASADAIHRTLATWEQEDAARLAWDAALRSRIVPVVPRECVCGVPSTCRDVRRVGLCLRSCLGLAQSGDDLVQHVPDPRPSTAD